MSDDEQPTPCAILLKRIKAAVDSQRTVASTVSELGVTYVPGVVPIGVMFIGVCLWILALLVFASEGWKFSLAAWLIAGLLFLMGLPLVVASYLAMRLPKPTEPVLAIKNFLSAIGRKRWTLASRMVGPVAWRLDSKSARDIRLASPADFEMYWQTIAAERGMCGVARAPRMRAMMLDDHIAVVGGRVLFDRTTTLYVPLLGTVNVAHGDTVDITKLVVRHGREWFLMNAEFESDDEREMARCIAEGDFPAARRHTVPQSERA